MARHPKAVALKFHFEKEETALPSIIGRDERGWVMIDVPASERATIHEMTIGNKPIVLVAQPHHVMRVYVNPDPDITQMDEWEVPAGDVDWEPLAEEAGEAGEAGEAAWEEEAGEAAWEEGHHDNGDGYRCYKPQ